MPVRLIARENRVAVALAGLEQARSRTRRIPEILTQRQRRDRRVMKFDSTKPVAVFASVDAIADGEGVDGANAAAGGGYYGGKGQGGGGGGGQPF